LKNRGLSRLAAAALAIGFAATLTAQSRGTASQASNGGAGHRGTLGHDVEHVAGRACGTTTRPDGSADERGAAGGTRLHLPLLQHRRYQQRASRSRGGSGDWYAAPTAAGRAGGGAASNLCGAGGGRGAVMAPNNQTLRQIVHLSIGGDRFRFVVSNAFGTVPLEIGGASVALRGQAGGIVAGSSKPLTFSGSPNAKVSPGATMISDPVALKAPDFADLAIDLFLPGDTGATTLTRHAGACQTSYVAAGNHVGEASSPRRRRRRRGTSSSAWKWSHRRRSG
jgi:hypothetical protein